jgi:hypothetical protein
VVGSPLGGGVEILWAAALINSLITHVTSYMYS